MKLVFTSLTTIEFDNKEVFESFIQTLPLNSIQKKNIIEGQEVTDKLDESTFPGTSHMVHKFKVTEEQS